MKEIIPVVAACIIQPCTDRVLLHRKDEGQDEEGVPRNPELVGRWEFPGGMVKYGETPELALKREIGEEIGREVFISKLIYAQTNIYKDGVHYLVLFYRCTINGYLDDIDGCKWFRKNQIADLQALPGTNDVISRLGE